MSLFHFAVDNSLGATFIGFGTSCMLFGIITTQVVSYFRRFSSDSRIYKFLVIGIWLLEAVDQTFIAHSTYYYTITNFSSPLGLIIGPIEWSLILQVELGALVGAIVKSSFALRVWRFSQRNILVTVTLFVFIVAQIVFASVFTAKAFAVKGLFNVAKLKTIGTLSLGSGVATDFLTAAALCFYLRKLRTGYERIDSLANRLMLYALNTGMLTSAISICTLTLYNVMPHNMIYIGSYFVLSKFYAISFMATLNTRRITKRKAIDRNGENLNYMSTVLDRTILTHKESQTKTQLEVGIHQEISVVTDFTDEPHGHWGQESD